MKTLEITIREWLNICHKQREPFVKFAERTTNSPRHQGEAEVSRGLDPRRTRDTTEERRNKGPRDT